MRAFSSPLYFCYAGRVIIIGDETAFWHGVQRAFIYFVFFFLVGGGGGGFVIQFSRDGIRNTVHKNILLLSNQRTDN